MSTQPYDPQIAIRIIEGLGVGLSPDRCATSFNLTPETIQHWREAHPDFDLACRFAEFKDLVSTARRVNSPRYWRGAAWKLERRYPEHYRLVTQSRPRPGETSAGQLASATTEPLICLDPNNPEFWKPPIPKEKCDVMYQLELKSQEFRRENNIRSIDDYEAYLKSRGLPVPWETPPQKDALD